MWAYFIKRTRTRTQTLRKPNPEKADRIPKLTVWVKDSFLRNSRELISDMTIAFSILAQKYPNKGFMVPKLDKFLFLQNFAFGQIRGCWCQIWQYFFKILAQKCPNKAILVSIFFVLFLFLSYFTIRQIRGYWFQIWQ